MQNAIAKMGGYLASISRRRWLQDGVKAAIAAGALGGRVGTQAAESGDVTSGADTWTAVGDWFDVCSCDLPCPCEFAQPATNGHCDGVLAYKVRRGHYGAVDISGLNVVLIGAFDGNIWEGGKRQEIGIYLDDRADAAQYHALEQIFTGAAGGWPATYAKVVRKVRGVEAAPIAIEIAPNLEAWSVRVGDMVEASAEALTGPTADPAKRVQLINPPGSETGPGQIATWGRGLRQRAKAFGFDVDLKGVSSKHIPFDWSGTVAA